MNRKRPIFKVTFILLLLAVGFAAQAQLNFAFREGTFMIKGRITDRTTKQAVSLANITTVNGKQKMTCDVYGNFVLYVSKTDTLRISSTGYLPRFVPIADIDSASFYTLEIPLTKDDIKIKEVVIYPWGNRDKFDDAFRDARDENKIVIAGIAPPKYSNKKPPAKLWNPASLIYDLVKRKRAANPDFKP